MKEYMHRLMILRPNGQYGVCSLYKENGELIKGAWTKHPHLIELRKEKLQVMYPKATFKIIKA